MIMSYRTNLYRTVADNELHFFTISNLNYIVFVSIVHIMASQYSILKDGGVEIMKILVDTYDYIW